MNRVIKKQIEIMDFHSIAVTATWIAQVHIYSEKGSELSPSLGCITEFNEFAANNFLTLMERWIYKYTSRYDIELLGDCGWNMSSTITCHISKFHPQMLTRRWIHIMSNTTSK